MLSQVGLYISWPYSLLFTQNTLESINAYSRIVLKLYNRVEQGPHQPLKKEIGGATVQQARRRELLCRRAGWQGYQILNGMRRVTMRKNGLGLLGMSETAGEEDIYAEFQAVIDIWSPSGMKRISMHWRGQRRNLELNRPEKSIHAGMWVKLARCGESEPEQGGEVFYVEWCPIRGIRA